VLLSANEKRPVPYPINCTIDYNRTFPLGKWCGRKTWGRKTLLINELSLKMEPGWLPKWVYFLTIYQTRKSLTPAVDKAILPKKLAKWKKYCLIEIVKSTPRSVLMYISIPGLIL
jgi:hypothetical protein